MSLFVEEEDKQPESNNSIPVTFVDQEVIPVFPEREINCALPLKYQQDIVRNTLTKDGLLVLGHGLGWEIITSNLIHALSTPFVNLGTNIKKKSLIILLNANDNELSRLQEELIDLSGGDDDDKLIRIGGETQSHKRLKIYKEGGIISISPMLLINDILSFMISPNDITGLIIFHAERIKEFGNDAFLIRLYRDRNNWGFIKAFSDKPESFVGFTPLATKLKILNLSHVFLWPRFHMTISESFNIRNKKDTVGKLVTEVKVGLTPNMKKLQSLITSVIEGCVRELKRHNSDLDLEYCNVDNIYDDGFADNIKASLQSNWHRLTPISKNLIFSIGFLSDLLGALLITDSIGFYHILNERIEADLILQRTQNRSKEPWLMSDEAGAIKSIAAARVFGTERGTYALEELPKWNELGKLVHDILTEKEKAQEKNCGPILIVCKNKIVASEIVSVLNTMQERKVADRHGFSCRKYMIEKLRTYCEWQNNISPRIKQISEELAGKQSDTGGDVGSSVSPTFSRNGEPRSKRRRTRGGSATAAAVVQSHQQQIKDSTKVDIQVVDELEAEYDQEVAETSIHNDDGDDDDDDEILEFTEIDDDSGIQNGFDFAHIKKEDQVIVEVFDEFWNTATIQELHPSHIIMYEHDLTFLRRVEMYQAINREHPAEVYLMYYRDSVEEQKHLLRIKKEKDAFSKLIKEKAALPKRFDTEADNAKFKIRKPDVVNTRIAGGAKFRTEADEMQVIVDSREFKSSTPFLIYLTGMTVIPSMITVGDYILSPTTCVERKSILDLIESFKNRRLFSQCKQMFRHYRNPILLIEFSNNESFSLQSFSTYRFTRGVKEEVDNDNAVSDKKQVPVQENIMKLLYQFPKLQIIWSSSPQETAQIFLELKSNQEEPNVAEALDKGVNKAITTGDGSPAMYYDAAIDFIMNIPGITVHNYEKVIQQVKNIEELVCLPLERFQDLLGKENGRNAFKFINHEFGV